MNEQWTPAIPNELAPDVASYAMEASAAQVRCYYCGHSWSTHTLPQGGCAAVTAPPYTLTDMLSGTGQKPLIAGPDGCSCPGWARGTIPYAVMKHFTALDGDLLMCECGHYVGEHYEEQGCQHCPCTTHDLADVQVI